MKQKYSALDQFNWNNCKVWISQQLLVKSSPIKFPKITPVRVQTAHCWPELVAHEAVDDEVSCGDEAEEDVGHVAKQVVPGREPLALSTHGPTRPAHTLRSSNATYWGAHILKFIRNTLGLTCYRYDLQTNWQTSEVRRVDYQLSGTKIFGFIIAR